MANLTTAYATPFTPTGTVFNVSVDGGSAQLMRRNNGGAAWVSIEVLGPGGYTVDNVVGAIWKFTAPPAGTTAAAVSADE
jgi:hypothetical protein